MGFSMNQVIQYCEVSTTNNVNNWNRQLCLIFTNNGCSHVTMETVALEMVIGPNNTIKMSVTHMDLESLRPKQILFPCINYPRPHHFLELYH